MQCRLGVVRREMLHALLRRGGHPAAYFLEKCNGCVDFYGSRLAQDPPPTRLALLVALRSRRSPRGERLLVLCEHHSLLRRQD